MSNVRPDPVPRGFSGEFWAEFAKFADENSDRVFHLRLDFNKDESAKLCKAFCWDGAKEQTVWLGAPWEHAGIEFGFSNTDSELYMNTRHQEYVFTEGYFKVHGISGPRQGWMSFVLKAVGKEHVQ
ncbi:MAG: hypothetical protein R8K20_08180, partial [Gallionellaceae bacterium]